MIHRMGIIVAAALLSACTTGYQKFNVPLIGPRGGYTDEQVGPGELIKVSFQATAWTKAASVQDYLLLRSAEVAKSHDKPYFTVYSSIAEAIVGRSRQDALAGRVMDGTYGFVYILLEDKAVPGSLETAVTLDKYAYLSGDGKGDAR
jgi:hypothetical protein